MVENWGPSVFVCISLFVWAEGWGVSVVVVEGERGGGGDVTWSLRTDADDCAGAVGFYVVALEDAGAADGGVDGLGERDVEGVGHADVADDAVFEKGPGTHLGMEALSRQLLGGGFVPFLLCWSIASSSTLNLIRKRFCRSSSAPSHKVLP